LWTDRLWPLSWKETVSFATWKVVSALVLAAPATAGRTSANIAPAVMTDV
jgi:hypothetical protein